MNVSIRTKEANEGGFAPIPARSRKNVASAVYWSLPLDRVLAARLVKVALETADLEERLRTDSMTHPPLNR